MDILDKERLKECRLKLGITKQEAAKRIQIFNLRICDTRPVHVTLLYRLFLKWLKFFNIYRLSYWKICRFKSE